MCFPVIACCGSKAGGGVVPLSQSSSCHFLFLGQWLGLRHLFLMSLSLCGPWSYFDDALGTLVYTCYLSTCCSGCLVG